jgi:hypothetical protein
MPGFLVVPPQAASPGGLLNPARVPFWGLNDNGDSCNEGPLYALDPWDTFFINDDQLPGECSVQNVSLAAIEVEKFKGKNQSGASIKFFGYQPGGFDVVSQIATPEQWEVFQQIQDKYWAGPLKPARPPQITVRVRHPDINRLRVYQAVLVGVSLAEDGKIEGAKNFRLKFHEQVPTKATATKKAGGPVPEDTRLIASNATPPLPSKNPANMSLNGPPPNTLGDAP